MNKKITGLILAGGKSSRMGFDKRKIKLSGKPVITALSELLNPVCDAVVVSCKPGNPPDGNHKLLFDDFSCEGPLAGIITALKIFPENNILVIAADQPFITESDLADLITYTNELNPVTAFLNPSTHITEPFPSLWRQTSLPLLMEFLKSNKPSPMDFIRASESKILNSQNPDFAINLNFPEDLKNHDNLTVS